MRSWKGTVSVGSFLLDLDGKGPPILQSEMDRFYAAEILSAERFSERTMLFASSRANTPGSKPRVSEVIWKL
jgi:hypothetical protein